MFLASDVVAAHTDEIHGANVFNMENIGIKIITTGKIGKDG